MANQRKNKIDSKSEVSEAAVPTHRNRKDAIRAGIIGGAGYTGGELIRLLIHHPYTSVSFIHSRSNAGKAVHSVHQDLLGDTDLKFADDVSGHWGTGRLTFYFFVLAMEKQRSF